MDEKDMSYNKIDAAASQILIALAAWIGNARERKSCQEMTVEELVSDFVMENI